eukprot:TRINITY_DN31966_c0_g1_i1.p1 TRINITY_DN31966_c0_g1~~TRINITY_DN31966_c0_g1_i1.p1  ORF type:complete len:481 (-),score=82.70 TRINITY_DN31966_c0_g1_i1:13-1455(-)
MVGVHRFCRVTGSASARLCQRLALPHAACAGSVRGMSIMNRYRKLRPVPEPTPEQFETPPEFRDGRDGMEPPATSSNSLPEAFEDEILEPPRRPRIYARAPVPAEAQFCTFDPPIQPAKPRSLKIGLAGPPNAGKSSLMNAILDCPVSTVSPKINTTKEGVRGIRTNGSDQLVFLDVPGIIPSHQRKENRELVAKAWQGYQECELCLLVIDVVKRPTQDVFDMVRQLCSYPDLGDSELRRRMRDMEAGDPETWLPRPIPGSNWQKGHRTDRPPVVLVLNKIDKATEFRWVQSREREMRAHGRFLKVFYVSAKKEQGLEKLVQFLETNCVERPWSYPAELRTTMSYLEQLKHQINFHLYKWFNVDVPYKIEHQTLGWTPRLDGTLLIEHELIVKDSVVARMICGMRNTIVMRLRDQVGYKLTKMWGMPVEVFIWVRPLRLRLSIKDRADRGWRVRRPEDRESPMPTTSRPRPRDGPSIDIG